MMVFFKKIIRIILFPFAMRTFLRLIIGIQFGDNSVFKNVNQYIIAGNHNSHLDTMAVLSALPIQALQNTYPVAAADYFGRSKLTTMLSRFFINAILIKRTKDGSGPNPIEQMDEAIKNGQSIVIFPEGSRGKPEELQPFKRGIGILLQRNTHVPFIPVYMEGMGKALPRGEGLLVPFDGKILIGEPSYINSGMAIEEIVLFVESKVLELKNKSEPVKAINSIQVDH